MKPRPDPTQGTQRGLELKESGQAQVEEHNESWVLLVRGVAREIANTVGHVSTDDLWAWCSENGAYPKHPNAMGTVFRRDGWEVVGLEVSRRPEARGRMIRIWSIRSRRMAAV